MAMLSISEMQMSLVSRSSTNSFNLTESCVEEMLLKSSRDAGYSGGAITLPQGTCSVNMSKNGDNWSAIVSGTFNNFARSLRVDFVRDSTITITNWKEI